MYHLKNKTILISSNEKWGKMWFSKHHFANELSKNGNKVYFINPPGDWKLSNLYKFFKALQFESVDKNLIVINYHNIFPSFGILFIVRINDFILFKRLNKYLNTKKDNEVIFIGFNVFSLIYVKYLNALKTIFYSVDWYKYGGEIVISKHSDLILVTNAELKNKLIQYNANIHIVPHGIPDSIFNLDATVNVIKNRIVFCGSITSRTDLLLLLNLASKYLFFDFQFAGLEVLETDEEKILWKKITELSNVVYHGVLPFNEMISLIASSNVCLAPYKNFYAENQIGISLGSLKIFQYLALGKKVLTSPFEEFSNEKFEKFVTTYHNSDQALFFLDDLINNYPINHLVDEKKDILKEYKYSNILLAIEKHMN